MTAGDPLDNEALGKAFLDVVDAMEARNPHRQFAVGEYDPPVLEAAEQAAQERLEDLIEARQARRSRTGARDRR